jgi:cupin 2 domain-containing protein
MSISSDIWNDLPHYPQKLEIIDEIFHQDNIRIERIMSSGQVSPAGFWYDQTENEWLILISGYAELSLQNPDQTVFLKPGDFLYITAHRKHRINITDPDNPTLWITLFFI